MAIEPSAMDSIGPYRILRPLGKGGMGAVYLAHDPALNRQVAIKQLLADDDEPGYATLKKRFLREAQSAANLNHVNIVTIYHIGEHARQPFIVMEYVDGGSWAYHLRQNGAVAWPAALAAIRDAAAGLAAAHAAGIIHRDIKPANLMRRSGPTGEGSVTKIVDFGLARAALFDGELTHPGAFVGSPSYVSPEQAACKPVGPTSDMYSLGCTLFAMLTGHAPFSADDAADILEMHRAAAVPELEGAVEAVPGAVEGILHQMMAKSPMGRMQSAQLLVTAIDRLPLEVFAGPSKGGHAERKVAEARGATLKHPQAMPRMDTSSPVPASPQIRTDASVEALRRQLEDSKAVGDKVAERDTHVSLFHAYSRMNLKEEATRAARQALALHLKMARPARN